MYGLKKRYLHVVYAGRRSQVRSCLFVLRRLFGKPQHWAYCDRDNSLVVLSHWEEGEKQSITSMDKYGGIDKAQRCDLNTGLSQQPLLCFSSSPSSQLVLCGRPKLFRIAAVCIYVRGIS